VFVEGVPTANSLSAFNLKPQPDIRHRLARVRATKAADAMGALLRPHNLEVPSMHTVTIGLDIAIPGPRHRRRK
jgi:hypothetical protein